MSRHTDLLPFFQAKTPQETYRVIVNKAMQLTHADYGSIFLYRDRDLFRVYASTPLLYQITPRKKGYTRTTLHKHSSYLIQEENGEINPLTVQLLSVQSDIAVTMMHDKKPIGLLTVMTKKPHRLTRKEYAAVKNLIPWASQAIVLSMRLNERRAENEAMNLFISMAAHELKSPMTSIYGLSQIIDQKVRKRDGVSAEMLDKLLGNEKRLIRLINELLMMSRIRKGEFQYSMNTHDLREILNRAIIEFGFSYPKHRFEFINMIISKHVQVYCDFDKIIQVFVNLLNNAGKYSSPSSNIKIVLSRSEEYYQVDIHDEGAGIPKEQFPSIFLPFFRANNIKDSRAGLGLGLYLTKLILEAHKAKIRIRSQVDIGTSVTVLLRKHY